MFWKHFAFSFSLIQELQCCSQISLLLSQLQLSLLAFSYMGHGNSRPVLYQLANFIKTNKQNFSPNNSTKWCQMIESPCLGHRSTLDPNTWPREWEVLTDQHDQSWRQAQGKLRLINAASAPCSWSQRTVVPKEISMRRRKNCGAGGKQHTPALVRQLKLGRWAGICHVGELMRAIPGKGSRYTKTELSKNMVLSGTF